MTRRRAFVAAAATALAAFLTSPYLALAQDAAKPRIAIVNASRPVEELTNTGHPMYVAFLDELARRGYVEGETVEIERWSGRDWTDRDALARAVVESAPDLIYAASGAAIGPHLAKATQSIPIVFLGRDPVGYGLVTELAHPGGNVTGFSTEPGAQIEGKRLQLLAEAVPSATRIAYLNVRWAWPEIEPHVRQAADQLGIALVPVILDPPVDEAAYRRAIDLAVAAGADALVVGGSQESNAFAPLIGALALSAHLPAIHGLREFADAGGLMTYGVNYPRELRRAAAYVARVLDGEMPGDLPVRQPESFDLTINQRTATALGIVLPPKLLIQATELIE